MSWSHSIGLGRVRALKQDWMEGASQADGNRNGPLGLPEG